MKLMFFYKGYFRGNKGCFTEILIKTKSKLTLNFLAFLQDPGLFPPLYLTDRGYSKSLANKSQIKDVYVCVHSLSCISHFFSESCVEQCWTVPLQHI